MLVAQEIRTLARIAATIVGAGTVSSSPGGVVCSDGTCSGDFTHGTAVTLTAVPASGSVFVSWFGDCTGTSATCTLTAAGDMSATAYFGDPWSLYVLLAGPGGGRVTSSPAGINCVSGGPAAGCNTILSFNTSVVLTAVPNVDSRFAGWGGEGVKCGIAASCTVSIAAARLVTATFTKGLRVTVSVNSGSGRGSVVSSPAGISCPGVCSVIFPEGTEITLTPRARSGSKFVGWDGACYDRSELMPCTVLLTDDLELNAEFSNPKVAKTIRIGKRVIHVPEDCTVLGTSGNNILRGTARNDVICGLTGNDRLIGLGGNDILIGGSGNDILIGGSGNDILIGGSGNDRLYAKDGKRDVLDGGAGRDLASRDKARDETTSIEAWIS